MKSLIKTVAVSIFTSALLPAPLMAQAPEKRAVKFTCKCDDSVGARYATSMRDLIASSPRYRAVTEFTEGKEPNATWNWGIRVVSLDPTVGKTGNSTILAVTLTFGDLYVDSVIQSCLSESLKRCAEDTLASLDSDIADILKK